MREPGFTLATTDSGTKQEVPPPKKQEQDYGLVIAVVGAVITLLIIGTLAYAQRIVDVATYLTPLAGSLVTIFSAVFGSFLSRRGHGTATIIIATIVTIALIAVAALGGAWWLQTEPGRSAARTTDAWPVVYHNTLVPDKPCVIDPENEFGSGEMCVSEGVLTVWLHSNKSAAQFPFDSTPVVGGQWYAQVDMRLLQGPPDAVCMLMFGFSAPSRWYTLRVQGQQPGVQGGSAGVSQYEGTYPGRFYSGPTVQRSIDLGSWASAAIKVNGNSYDFFVNNRLVAHDQKIDGVQGGVNIGTLAPGSEYRTTEACQFRDLIVRQR